MSFDFASVFLSQFILMFLAIVTGLLFGKIKFGKFRFGISGALFTGLLIGWGAFKYAASVPEGAAAFKASQKLLSVGVVSSDFFNIFLILFVCAVGLLAAKDMGIVLKKYGLKFVILGMVITFTSAGATYAATFFSKDANPYEVSGVYTGALTSSPGLAAAIETAKGHATERTKEYDKMNTEEKKKFLQMAGVENIPEDIEAFQLTDEIKQQYITNAEASIGAGHAIGYPFGVLIVILAVNFFPTIFKIDVEKEKLQYKKELDDARKSSNTGKEIKESKFDILGFVIACTFGYIIGNINIYLPFIGYFSLGSTGGVLIGALVLGYIGKIGNISFRMDSKVLGVIRDIALAFFLAIVGLRYGYKAVDALVGAGAYLGVVSLVVGVVGMLIGFFLGKYVLKINWPMLSGAICGGMTSTPGLGAAVEALGSDEPAAGYGATYPFALLGMVIFTIILHKLPM
ncbi:aspartate-alanine antiporter-like transporter [Paraclostridium bifermentans]|uniref:aspartate-alanine antiporter-like transporter n=1 Tax=Paraclostridium bifermentans TaxID=1490 RepID=UPI00359CB4CC